MDQQELLKKINNLVVLLNELTGENENDDHTVITQLLHRPCNEVVIPARRYVLSRPLHLEESLVAKTLRFDGAILFFDFKTSKNNPAIVVNTSNCNLIAGTFVSNDLVFQVNGNENVFNGLSVLGRCVLEGIGNQCTNSNITSLCKRGICVDDEDEEDFATVGLKGDNAKLTNCELECTMFDLCKGIDQNVWKFWHASILNHLHCMREQLQEEIHAPWVSYQVLYPINEERLTLLNRFLSNQPISGHYAKKVMVVLEYVLWVNYHEYATKFFAMLQRHRVGEMDILIMELYALFKSKDMKNSVEIQKVFKTLAKKLAIERVIWKMSRLNKSEQRIVVGNYLYKSLGLKHSVKPEKLGLLNDLETQSKQLWKSIRDQMLSDTSGFNGIVEN